MVTGEGKAFSAGGDFQFISDRTVDEPNNNALIMKKVLAIQILNKIVL